MRKGKPKIFIEQTRLLTSPKVFLHRISGVVIHRGKSTLVVGQTRVFTFASNVRERVLKHFLKLHGDRMNGQVIIRGKLKLFVSPGNLAQSITHTSKPLFTKFDQNRKRYVQKFLI